VNLLRAPRTILCATLVALAVSACSRPPLTGPPDLKPGREECAECGMLVSEDRFSAASLVTREGERLYLYFDDIGCLLDYERGAPESLEVHERYTHDHATRQWLDAEDAAYLLAGPQKLTTPMGSGIAAFAARSAAESARAEHGGDILDLAALRRARQAWMEERYGKPPVPSNPAR
jgi:nitrous oxide reductase accessory protein NosL